MMLETCNIISDLVEYGATGDSEAVLIDQADALGTLAHEVKHFLVDGTEAEVECSAMRSLAGTGKSLGPSADDAALLAKVFRTKVYPDELAKYRKGGCPP